MEKSFYTAIKERRSIYGINKDIIISDERLKEIIDFSIKNTPSAFNSQSSRVALLLGNHHDRFWNIAENELRKILPKESFLATEKKVNSFAAGYGTVVFFEDMDVITSLQAKYKIYSASFPVWAQQTNGILQYIIWTSLSMEGYGASLQHYSELIDMTIKKEFNIPLSWKMIAQMPFGKPTIATYEKEFEPIDKRVMLYN